MNRELFEYIFTLFKSMKKPIVAVYPNGTIFGTDEQFASISVIYTDHINMSDPYIFYMNELMLFMRNVSAQYNEEIIFGKFELLCTDKKLSYMISNRLELLDQLFNLHAKLIDIKLKNVLSEQQNIQEQYYEMLSLKAADGAKMYNIDNFVMSSFNAIHPVNKSDKVDVIFREYDNYSYTAEFIIHKKQYDIHEFFRFRYI